VAKINLIIPHLDKDDPEVFTKLESFLRELAKQNETNDLVDKAVTSAKRTGIDVKAGSFTCPVGIGDYTVSGVKFKPRYVDFTAGRDNVIAVNECQGTMDYNGNQWIVAGTSKDDEQFSKKGTTRCITVLSSTTGNVVVSAQFTSMNDDGFTIEFLATNVGFTINWKAVR